jgi:hypothetical protein
VYPDDFESGARSTASPPSKREMNGDEGSPGELAGDTPDRAPEGDASGSNTTTVEMTPAEIDEVIAGAAQAGRSDVLDAGETDTQQDHETGQSVAPTDVDDQPATCTECEGSSLVGPDRARQALGRYYRERSALSVLARRRLKKLDRRIRKQDPSYVCPKCWTAFG